LFAQASCYDHRVQDVLQALSEPHRQEVVRLLSGDELSAGEIASHFTLTRQAVSQHLRVLKEAGLLEERRAGTRRLYRLSPERIEELTSFLDSLWGDGLARLKREVESPPRGRRASRGGGADG
jgi:DNA-binding transcriptional ArsR family regulator